MPDNAPIIKCTKQVEELSAILIKSSIGLKFHSTRHYQQEGTQGQ